MLEKSKTRDIIGVEYDILYDIAKKMENPEIVADYVKNFDGWNGEKKLVHQRNLGVYPKEREIWNIKLGINVGNEADGKRGYYRPALVIKRIGCMYLCIPMTTKGKKDSPYYLFLKSVSFFDFKGNSLSSSLMLSHIRTFDARRFYKHKTTVTKQEFSDIQKILQVMFFAR